MNKENKNILLLLIRGQTTHFGNIIFDYANKLLIANLAVNSSFFMMIYLSSESVIQLFLNLFTGHFADFNNRKRILILTDLIAGAVTFLLFLFYNPDNIWAFVIVNIILAILFSFNRPTYKAIVRDLLSSEGIHKYNSISKILAEVVAVSAPIFSVFVIQEFGFKYGMLINSISFFISAICEHYFHILKVNKANNTSFLSGIADGFKYVVNDKALLIILVASAVLNFLDAIYSFYLPFTSSFSGYKNIYAYILIAQSIGSIGGALIAGVYKKTLKPEQFFHLLLPGAGALFLIGFASSSQLLVLVLFGIFTSSVTLFNVNLMSHLQITVNSEFLGRVFSIIFTISGIFVPFGSFVASVIDMKNWNIFQYIGLGQFVIYILCLIIFIQIKKPNT
ncbi:enterobactin exporter EntS [Streptococcus sanguinis]|jgi:transporter, major facilitator|uniref:Enterobactin exporter EntS n=1 Tax=Streptococcus sanguinis TaxID=1305 RepID=A0A3P1S4Q5_STRSA|nr:MFS transporter [Streptococcus sanguinis]EGF07499.1 major facilitator superfamily permease [Streptococcus sanguinis SK1057]KAA0119298.1 MFS transporter [Streptococcus sanguinis]MBZ2065601.1 MFS transporter [Streptococcus sanguinis]MCY7012976.1 MFS transporter [Streptococcus sanguinis]MCY7025552.1 MFS transporter [Streptococcus sanguinis]